MLTKPTFDCWNLHGYVIQNTLLLSFLHPSIFLSHPIYLSPSLFLSISLSLFLPFSLNVPLSLLLSLSLSHYCPSAPLYLSPSASPFTVSSTSHWFVLRGALQPVPSVYVRACLIVLFIDHVLNPFYFTFVPLWSCLVSLEKTPKLYLRPTLTALPTLQNQSPVQSPYRPVSPYANSSKGKRFPAQSIKHEQGKMTCNLIYWIWSTLKYFPLSPQHKVSQHLILSSQN